MADQQEQVSILGVMKDEISTPAKQAGTALGGIGAETEKTNTALNRLADILEKTQAALEKQVAAAERLKKSKEEAVASSALDEQVSRRTVSRIDALSIRMVALAYAVNNVGSSFGKASVEADSFRAGLQTVASTVAVFPNLFGGAIGIVLGLVAAFTKASEAIAEINKKTAELVTKQEETFQKLYAAVGKDTVEKRLADNSPLKAIADQMAKIKENAEGAAAKARELQQAVAFGNEDRGKDIQRQIAEEFARLQRLKSGDELGGFGSIPASQAKINKLIQARNELSKAQYNGDDKKALDDANRQVEEAIRDYEDLKKAQEAVQKFDTGSASLSKLLDDEIKVQDELTAGVITEQQAAERRLAIEEHRLEIYRGIKEFFGEDEESQNKIVLLAQQKVELAERDVAALKEAKAYEDDARKNFAESQAEKEAALKESAKLGLAVSHTIAQGFSDATGALIDGLVLGNLNMQQFAGQFALNLSKMIAQALVLKAVMAGLGAIGLNSGGEVGSGFENNHYATGGSVPGPNVNADIVPAMLTPGEYVVKRSAVSKYGAAAMNAINRGAVPSSVLSRYAAPSTLSVSGRHAQGGEIPYGAGAVPKPAVAFVMSSDGEMERLLAGGDGAFMRFFERNRGKIRANLGIGGR